MDNFFHKACNFVIFFYVNQRENFNFEFNKFSEKCTLVKLFSVFWIFAQIYVVQGAVLYRTRQVAPVSHWCTRFMYQCHLYLYSSSMVLFTIGDLHVLASSAWSYKQYTCKVTLYHRSNTELDSWINWFQFQFQFQFCLFPQPIMQILTVQ